MRLLFAPFPACFRPLHPRSGVVLDAHYLRELGTFDVVYSWGVLHHTGAMWLGIENAMRCVSDSTGILFLAIYNDQGTRSHIWWLIKRCYNALPTFCSGPFAAVAWLLTHVLSLVKHTLRLRPKVALAPLLSDRHERGMNAKHDWIDWIGGFPYEFATFESLQAYVESRGFTLINARRTTGWGCNEFVFWPAISNHWFDLTNNLPTSDSRRYRHPTTP